MHKKKQKLLSSIQVLTMGASICISGFLLPTVSNADSNLRISGLDRYETSMNILKHLGSKDEIYIATGKNFPDALSIGPISYVQEKPLLLIRGNDSEIKSLKESKIKKITIIGGTNSISKDFENKLKQEFEVTRISGKDRYETSRKIAQLATNKKVGVATGETYPDALAASSYLGKNKMSLILVDNNKNVDIPEDNEAVYTFGGINSVNKTYGKRISGKDRYETSRKIAEEFKGYENIVIASGENFADSLSSVPLGKKYNAPTILVKGNKIDDNLKNIIKKTKKVIFVGGESSISKNIEKEINDIRIGKNEGSSSKPNYSSGSKPNENSSIEKRELKKAKDELGRRIEELKKTETNMYTKNSYRIFNDKIANAENNLKKENDIKKIKAALEDLKYAEKLLIRRGDIQKLKNDIANAGNEAKKVDVYTEESIKELEKAIEEINKSDFENLNEAQTNDLIKKLNDSVKSLRKKNIPQKSLADDFDINKFEKISVKDINSPSDEDLEQLKNKVVNAKKIERIENKKELKIIFKDNSSKTVNYTDVFKNIPVEPGVPETLKKVKIKAASTYSFKRMEIKEDADSKAWLEEIKKGNAKISAFMNKNQANKRELKPTKEEVDGYKVGEKSDKNNLFIYGAKENEFISIEVKGYEKIYVKVIKDAFSSQFNYFLQVVDESEVPSGSQDSESNKVVSKLKEQINRKIVEYEQIKKTAMIKYISSSFVKYEKKILEAKNLVKEDNVSPESLENIIKEIDKTKSELKLLGDSNDLLKQIEVAKNLSENVVYRKAAREDLKEYLKKYDSIKENILNKEDIPNKEEVVKTLLQEIGNRIAIFNNSQRIKIIVETKNYKISNRIAENILIFDSFLGTKIADLVDNSATQKIAKNIWDMDFSLNGSKPLGWKINDGNVMNEVELKNTILAESHIKKENTLGENIKITAVYDEVTTGLKKVVTKDQSFFPMNAQVVIEKNDANTVKWLEKIGNKEGQLKVLNNMEVLKPASNSFQKGYSTSDGYLLLYELEDKQYVVVKVDGYEDVFFKTRKSGFDTYITRISKDEVPSELISKI